MGERGPPPKRSSERRRRNKGSKPAEGKAAPVVKKPPASKGWHPIAKRWFNSLADSGQSKFYEPSDWAMAYVVAESISRDLKPQVVAVPEKTGEPVFETVPMKGASLSAYLKAMTALMVSEGDRRRAGLELERPDPSAGDDEQDSDKVVAMENYRKSAKG